MKPVRIFRHVACEGPGYLETFLKRNNIPFEIVCIDEGITVPKKLDDISGLIFMGGSMNVTDTSQWVTVLVHNSWLRHWVEISHITQIWK